MTDLDGDMLGDFCEYQLALVFRPLLSTSPLENHLGRESYWAAGYDGSQVVVVYMLGYYLDPGVYECGWSPPVGCSPHLGDNEFVVSYLSFDAGTQHWQLSGQFHSAHWRCKYEILGIDVDCDYSTYRNGRQLEYPTKDGTYTRVYVADRKHANYATRSVCNSGAVFDSDDCSGNVDSGRIHVGHLRNVGSQYGQFISNVASVDNPGVHPGLEYFWQDVAFCGWNVTTIGGRGGCSPTSYADVLAAFLSLPS